MPGNHKTNSSFKRYAGKSNTWLKQMVCGKTYWYRCHSNPPPHKEIPVFPLYVQVDVTSCVPRPQVVEQDEAKLQDDQVGHDCVLHVSFLCRLKDPLSNTANTLLYGVRVLSVHHRLIHI